MAGQNALKNLLLNDDNMIGKFFEKKALFDLYGHKSWIWKKQMLKNSAVYLD